jgi:hypothetical protein
MQIPGLFYQQIGYRSIALLVTMIVLLSVRAWADEAELNTFTRLEAQMDEVFRKHAPEIVISIKARRPQLEQLFQERIPGTTNLIDKISIVDVIDYEVTWESETNSVNISRYKSIDEASAWMRRLIEQMPVQPPIRVPNLGEKGVRFPGIGEDDTGSMYFRRGTILVHLNAEKSRSAVRIGRLIDEALKRTLEVKP